MRIFALAFKLWLALAVLAALSLGVWLIQAGAPQIFIDDEPVKGASAMIIGIGIGLLVVIGVTLAIAIVCAVVPIAFLAVLFGLAVVLVAVGAILAGVLTSVALPILIPLGLCVLLVRLLSRPRPLPTR